MYPDDAARSNRQRRGWRVAIVGCGRMGLVHAERLATDGRATIVGLCDSNQSLAVRLRDQYAPAATIHADLPALLTDAHPDIAVICTPTAAHFDHVVDCQNAGVHILCEKPLADSRDRIDRLITAAERGPAQQAIAYQRRSWATFRSLRREILSGRWGQVRAVSMQVSEAWQPTIAGTWRDDPQANFGGFIGDAGSHKLDAVFFVTALTPRQVFARTWNCGSRVEIVASVAAVLDNDVPLTMSFVGNGQVLSEELRVSCADAELLIRDGRAWIVRTGEVSPLLPLEPDSNPVISFLDVLDGVATNAAPFACARPVYDLTSAILESASRQRSVHISSTPTN